MANIKCDACGSIDIDKGRAFDGRRAYRCNNCRHTWTKGLQGRERKYSKQRQDYQFKDTGASKNERI